MQDSDSEYIIVTGADFSVAFAARPDHTAHVVASMPPKAPFKLHMVVQSSRHEPLTTTDPSALTYTPLKLPSHQVPASENREKMQTIKNRGRTTILIISNTTVT